MKRSWQRQILSLVGIIIVAANWRWAVQHLYSLPAQSIEAFASITNNAHYVIGTIVIFALTGKTITDWKSGTITNLLRPSPSRRVDPKDIDIEST